MIEILDKGFVQLDGMMGDDYSILKSARVSTGSESTKGDEKDRALLRRLWRDSHSSPFESVELKFHIKIPIFIARQIMRHRTFSFSEMSARYVDFEKFEYYVPDKWRHQSKNNHQGSDNYFNESENKLLNRDYKDLLNANVDTYEALVANDVAKEMARMVMPVSTYTEFHMKGNLRNWFHFLELRLDSHAQYEVRILAEAILKIMEETNKLKWSIEIFKEEYKISQIMMRLKNKHKNDYNSLYHKLNSLLEEIS